MNSKTFIDFACKDLIGQQVILCTVFKSGKPSTRFIRFITDANRHHFSIDKSALQFDYSGRQLFQSDSVEQQQVSACLLLTEAEAKRLSKRWSLKKKSLVKSEIKKHYTEIDKLKSKLNGNN
jgi:hypothetical protein